jgi:hypothetical protein
MMANNWREEYQKLRDFVINQPDILIEPDRVSIPENVRLEFYRLFDATRSRFAAETSPTLFNDACILSAHYLSLETEVTKILGLAEVILQQPLVWFVKDPADALARDLFDPIFDLLRGKVDIAAFEAKYEPKVKAQLLSLFRSGYEKWVSLALIRLAVPEKLFQVKLRDPGRSEHAHILGQFEALKEDIPPAVESRDISFDHSKDIIFNNPDYIIQADQKYLSIRSRLGNPITVGSYVSQKREWLPLNEVTVVEPSSILVYIDGALNEITLVGDKEKICRPDMIIECIDQPDWYTGERPAGIKRQNDTLKPRFGTFLVARQPVPEGAAKNILTELIQQTPEYPEPIPDGKTPVTGINLLTVEFNVQMLEPVINLLLPKAPKPARRSFRQRLLAWLTGRASHTST